MNKKIMETDRLYVLTGETAYCVNRMDKEELVEIKNFNLSKCGTVKICDNFELSEEECEKGIIAFGSSLMETTQSFILKFAMQNSIKGSVIFVDPKGEIHAKSAQFQEEICGRKVLLIDPFNPQTIKINPLESCITPDDVYDMAYTMLVNGSENSNEIWISMATPFFAAALLYAKGLDKPYATIKTALELIDKYDSFEELEREYRKNKNINKWFEVACRYLETYRSIYVENVPVNSYRSFILSFINQTTLWRNSDIEKFTSESNFDVNSLREEDIAVYFAFDQDVARKIAPLLGLFLQQTFDTLLRGSNSTKCVWVCLGDFLNVEKVQNIKQIYSIGRFKNIIPVMVAQNDEQVVNKCGKNTWMTIWSCAGVKVVLNDIDKNAFLKKMLELRK